MTKIEICKTCEGEGFVWHQPIGQDAVKRKCTRCKAKGKLINISVSYSVPYTDDRSEIRTAEEAIHHIMRKL